MGFILDLVGYTVGSDLASKSILEPSFGGGDFLLPIVERLLDDSVPGRPGKLAHERLVGAVRAVELHTATAASTRVALGNLLRARKFSPDQVGTLLHSWIVEDDFLLNEDLTGKFHCIVGNPPYVRQELIPDALLIEYRRRFSTLYDRADLYVPFMEKCLGLLADGGALGLICSDRWMKNRYGGPLRDLISTGGYHLSTYVDMVNTAAFKSEVIAYTAITVITRPTPHASPKEEPTTRIVRRPEVSQENLSRIAAALTAPKVNSDEVTEARNVVCGRDPWLLDVADEVAALREMEGRLPSLEEADCQVGIGVATGCDRAFIGKFDELPVEPSRKLPLVMARDLVDGRVKWSGMGVVNPFEENGSLASLDRYPKFGAYIRARKDDIARRNVAQRNPDRWYRTIDRISPALTTREKLLIPDIKGEANVALDRGELYPHHNLYWITSDEWNLVALQAVLRSAVARTFVRLYCVQMRGGFLRFQAQYLRRIRIPRWADVAPAMRKRLIAAGKSLKQDEIDAVTSAVYGLSRESAAAVGAVG